MPKRTAEFAKRARSKIWDLKIDRVTLFDGVMEWLKGGMAEYSLTWTALLYETIVSQKMELQWNKKK